jgi:hypothetical protein
VRVHCPLQCQDRGVCVYTVCCSDRIGVCACTLSVAGQDRGVCVYTVCCSDRIGVCACALPVAVSG